MELPTLTHEMIAVLSLLSFTVLLFVTEIVRIDVAAILIMVLLGVLSYLPGLGNLANVSEQSHLETNKGFKTIFEVSQNYLLIPESVFSVTTQTLTATDVRAQKKRNLSPIAFQC